MNNASGDTDTCGSNYFIRGSPYLLPFYFLVVVAPGLLGTLAALKCNKPKACGGNQGGRGRGWWQVILLHGQPEPSGWGQNAAGATPTSVPTGDFVVLQLCLLDL